VLWNSSSAIRITSRGKTIPDYSLGPEGVAYVGGRSKTIPESVHLKLDGVVAP